MLFLCNILSITLSLYKSCKEGPKTIFSCLGPPDFSTAHFPLFSGSAALPPPPTPIPDPETRSILLLLLDSSNRAKSVIIASIPPTVSRASLISTNCEGNVCLPSLACRALRSERVSLCLSPYRIYIYTLYTIII